MNPTRNDDPELLRCLRLKGLADAQTIAGVTGLADAEVAHGCASLIERGLLAATPRGLRLTSTGRVAFAELAAAERGDLDDASLQATYEAFCDVNGELKSVVSAWQMREKAGASGDSAQRERAIVDRLVAVHRSIGPVFARLEHLVPRLARYRLRLERAMTRIDAGEFDFIARPIIDSYHTIWFELHEDLLGLTGRTRAAEAEAGRAG